jgi:hypothetical protein
MEPIIAQMFLYVNNIFEKRRQFLEEQLSNKKGPGRLPDPQRGN